MSRSEPLDRNKTKLTHDVTNAAHFYLDERGFKPLETEVAVTNRWVADLCGVTSPTQTELIKLGLLSRSPTWKAPRWKRDAWYKMLMALLDIMTCLVEVKTSRSDFNHDKKTIG